MGIGISRKTAGLIGAAASILVAAVVVIVVAAGPSGTNARGRRVLTIGALLSLTGPGDVYGPQQLRAAQLAVSQINAEGGVSGAMLKLDVRDDHSAPDVGKSQMAAVIERDHALVVLGPSLSLVAQHADAIASEQHTPVLAVSNSANGIVGSCAYDCSWVWRDSLGEATAVPSAVQWLADQGHISSVAVINSNDVLGQDDAQIASHAFTVNGIPVVARIQVAGSVSVPSAVAAVLQKRPEVLFIGATSGALAAAIVRQARAAHFRGTIVGGNVFNSHATNVLAGEAGSGTISGAAWYAGNDFPANSQFIGAYTRRYGVAPDQFAAQAYTGVQVLAAAFRIAGSAVRTGSLAEARAAIERALYRVAVMTPLGALRFTHTHDVIQTVWVLRSTAAGSRLVGFCDTGLRC